MNIKKFLRFWWVSDLRVALVGICFAIIILAMVKMVTEELLKLFKSLDMPNPAITIVLLYLAIAALVIYLSYVIKRYRRFVRLEKGERVVATAKQFNRETNTIVFDLPVLSVDRVKFNRWLDPMMDVTRSAPVGRSFIVTLPDSNNPIIKALLRGETQFMVTVAIKEDDSGTITEIDNWKVLEK